MTGFGHNFASGPGFFIDSWGRGPLVIENRGKSFRFEFSEQFGPTRLRPDGEIDERFPFFGQRSPFWEAFTAWRKGGMRIDDDGVTCIWDHLKPTKVYMLDDKNAVVIEQGDDGGAIVDITEEMTAKGVGPTDFLDKRPRQPGRN